LPKDYRYNPFSDSAEAVSLTELYQVPAVSPYMIRLNEVPEVGDPSTMVVKAVTAISGTTRTYGSTFTEVAAVPASGSFRPDYNTKADSDDKWNTGTLLFAAADAGKLVEVTYNGLGTLASVKAPSYPAWFTDSGDGSDGDYAPTASTTLAGGTYNFSSVNIPAGVVITLTGCVILKCLGAFVCAGVITANGGNGAANNAGRTGGTSGGNIGGIGGNGGTTDVSAENGGIGFCGGIGGAGGRYYNGGTVATGGGVSYLDNGKAPTGNTNFVLNRGHLAICGGGGGGGLNASSGGGGGGGGGGSMYIIAHSASISGSLTANGGNGGDILSWSGSAYSGSGGGGGGGAVIVVANTISNTGTITANAGAAGVGKTTYTTGSAGSAGIVYLKELGAA
jgi:hypothetical protein